MLHTLELGFWALIGWGAGSCILYAVQRRRWRARTGLILLMLALLVVFIVSHALTDHMTHNAWATMAGVVFAKGVSWFRELHRSITAPMAFGFQRGYNDTN